MAIADEKRKGRTNDRPDEPAGEYSSSPCYLHEFELTYPADEVPRSGAWSDVRAWRRQQRRRLREQRRRLSGAERARADQAILETIVGASILRATNTGVYWPLQGEFDSRPLMRRVLNSDGRVAIPVIVTRGAALEFWEWDGRAKVRPQGPWDIPAPPGRHILEPAVLFIPLLGFDSDGHRLGNGGGYFDRTLVSLSLTPVTIGIGYELGRLDTIYPQDHDIPLDATVTEIGIEWHNR